ncbi:hypothetical protein TBLA_0C01910 [Henningerozyma blattae CBS 6284]|uniref:Zn(2)-C6 fungal-type domain-containing protein n=1 Tax=Henningerozyma blattae (strain ATCC 34711 / CBS 6284 / DSM 70876 / NBRC 10599 / NRRL Y-10934 / UCD 77-7) TaxID=1071380 RepID=I2H0V2_HENB6|nr:hypothetical protein TBLA_0C01910 [Tetrapisispora blattae CBS 6284]CCH60004.1 hypothetical protein TBLA_0C01910 [Tetrapisispora blattae CBS 6284]
MDSLEYLEDGFDPSSLTVKQIKRILDEHKVFYPKTNKKQTLLNTYKIEFQPLVPLLRAEYNSRLDQLQQEKIEQDLRMATDSKDYDSNISDTDVNEPRTGSNIEAVDTNTKEQDTNIEEKDTDVQLKEESFSELSNKNSKQSSALDDIIILDSDYASSDIDQDLSEKEEIQDGDESIIGGNALEEINMDDDEVEIKDMEIETRSFDDNRESKDIQQDQNSQVSKDDIDMQDDMEVDNDDIHEEIEEDSDEDMDDIQEEVQEKNQDDKQDKPNTKANVEKQVNSNERDKEKTSSDQLTFTKLNKKPRACLTCRKSKIGCDRTKPDCNNCTKKNKTCIYPDVPSTANSSNKPKDLEKLHPNADLQNAVKNTEQADNHMNKRDANTVENPKESVSSIYEKTTEIYSKSSPAEIYSNTTQTTTPIKKTTKLSIKKVSIPQTNSTTETSTISNAQPITNPQLSAMEQTASIQPNSLKLPNAIDIQIPKNLSDNNISKRPRDDSQSDHSLKENSSLNNSTKKRKIDKSTSLIEEKLSTKSPTKPNENSIVMENFDMDVSDSSMSSNSFIYGNDVNVTTLEENKIGSDPKMILTPKLCSPLAKNSNLKKLSPFKKRLAPDLANLNVSPEFANQLVTAIEENNDYLSNQIQPNTINAINPKTQTIIISNGLSEESSEDDQLSKPENEQVTTLSSNVKEDEMINSKNLQTLDRIYEDYIDDESNSTQFTKEPTEASKIDDFNVHNDKLTESDIKNKKQSDTRKLILFLKLVALILLLLPMILCFCIYRDQKMYVGYCDNQLPIKSVSEYLPDNVNTLPVVSKIDNWLEDHKPECIPCPNNAICYPMMQMKCKPDHIIRKNIFNLFGSLPLPDSCVRDNKREKIVNEIVKKSLEFLRAKNSAVSCGEGTDDLKSGVSSQDLYNIFNEARPAWIDDSNFEEIWSQVVKHLKDQKDILWRQLSANEISQKSYKNKHQANGFQKQKGCISQEPGSPENTVIRSISKKYIGIKCRFEREVFQKYIKYRLVIWTSSILVIIGKILHLKVKWTIQEQNRINDIATDIIASLKKKKMEQLHPNTPPYLSSVQLRDVYLSDVNNIQKKNILWKRISDKVEYGNTNINSSLNEVHGEIMKCWEWVGPSNDNSIPNNDNESNDCGNNT